MLSNLLALLSRMLGGYPTTLEEDRGMLKPGEAEKLSQTKRRLVQVRAEEKEIIKGSIAWVQERLAQALLTVLHPLVTLKGKTEGARAGEGWVRYLSEHKEEMEGLRPVFQDRFQCMHDAPLGSPRDTIASWTQICNLVFIWSFGLLENDCTQNACLLPRHWPLAGPSTSNNQVDWTGTEGSQEELGIRDTEMGTAEECELAEYQSLFCTKMKLWGAYLLAQWMEGQAFILEDINTMLMESVNLKHENSWSVPTVAALRLIQGLGSAILEVGDSKEHWVGKLKRLGVNAVHGEAADVGKAEHDNATLVLLWPDPQGQGTVGLDCVKAYKGSKLILIGEWGDRTFRLCPSGQSFSPECQEYVNENFKLVQSCSLPNWPLYVDALMLYERK